MNCECQKCECLSFAEIPHTSELFRDYLYDFQRVRRFYALDPREHASLPAMAATVGYEEKRRRRVADALERQNWELGGSAEALANVERLRRGAFAVVTGQQVGLFGGPLYAVLKALSAIALAEELSRQGLDTVPVFWLASEDHDLEEVNHVALLTPEGVPEIMRTASHSGPDAPVSEVRLDDDINGLLARATALLGDNEISAALRDAYRPGETLGRAFGRLFARLFAARGLVMLEASDAELHQIAEPVYRRAVAQAQALDAALLARGKELTAAGYHEQVKVTPASTLLFEKREGSRVVIRRVNGGFAAGQEKFSSQELLERIGAAPERSSANVLLRPVVQDFLLPTLAYIGGPAEIAYFAQAAVVYEQILGRVTPVLPRFSATLADSRAQRLLAKYGIALRDLFSGPEATRELLAVRSLPRALREDFDSATRAVAESLERVRESLQTLDSTLVDAARRAESKMRYHVERLRKRAALAEVRRSAELDRHARWLSDNLYPQKALQEREIAGVCFLARHGHQLLDLLYEDAKAGCPDHLVIHL